MNRQVFEEMIKEVGEIGEVSIVVDAVSSKGGYSTGQTYFRAKSCCIFPRNDYVMVENIRADFDVSDKKFICLAIPYERIVSVGVMR